MPDPQLSLYSGATLLGGNDNWGTTGSAQLVAAAAQVGAFPLVKKPRVMVAWR